MNEIKLVETLPVKRNEESIEILQELLELARNGAISEIAVVSWKNNGDYDIQMSSTLSRTKKLGCLCIIQHELLHAGVE